MTATAREFTLSQSVLHLRYTEKDGSIVVTPENQDRYVIKVGRAIELLRLAGDVEKFQQQFDLLLKVLGAWLQNAHDIEQAFLTFRDDALSFVVVRSQVVYDDGFEDSLSDLDFDVANDADLNLIKMNAIALPPASEDALSSFLDPEFILEYTGHAN